jgi:succinate-semialdehyde dehydrogenase/glutarate-semialdehyde dehydrogenase
VNDTRPALTDADLLREQAYIDGAWTGEAAVAVTDPALGEELARAPDLGAAEARTANDAAHKAQAAQRARPGGPC